MFQGYPENNSLINSVDNFFTCKVESKQNLDKAQSTARLTDNRTDNHRSLQ